MPQEALSCLLSCLFSIGFSFECNEILLMTGSPPLEEAIAQLVFVIVTLILFGAVLPDSALYFLTQLLLLCPFALMINGAHAHDQNEDFQSGIFADSNFWELRAYAKVAALVLAGALLPGLLIFGGAGFARRMRFNCRPPVPAPVPAPAPALPEAVPATPEAAPTTPEDAPALPLYPAVHGDDIDDVLVNAPRVTRLNTPLGWL